MTTKTGRLIAEAFRDGRTCTIKRTAAFTDRWTRGRFGHWQGMGAVELHGHTIAYIDREGVVWMSLAGYPTQTTRDRLNAILEAFGSSSRFVQRDFTQYYGIPSTGALVPVDSREWVPLAGPLGMRALLAARMAAE